MTRWDRKHFNSIEQVMENVRNPKIYSMDSDDFRAIFLKFKFNQQDLEEIVTKCHRKFEFSYLAVCALNHQDKESTKRLSDLVTDIWRASQIRGGGF